MAEINSSNLNHQEYNIHSGDTLISQVARVICVLMPRGLVVAGFSDRGDLLMMRTSDYKKNLPIWILDFFEHQFINEPLLSIPGKVAAAFVATDKGMVIPEVLFEEPVAEKWLKKLQFVEGNETTSSYYLREDKANYLYAWPGTIKSLMSRYFAKAKVYPIASYQFYKPYKSECSLLCTIASEQVYATLYNNRTLHWHQIFNYETAEDIAYQFKLLCQQYSIDADNMNLQCTITNKGLENIINDLGAYFPYLKDGTDSVTASDTSWTGTIYLLQQLYACAL